MSISFVAVESSSHFFSQSRGINSYGSPAEGNQRNTSNIKRHRPSDFDSLNPGLFCVDFIIIHNIKTHHLLLAKITYHPDSVGCCVVLAVLLQTGELLYRLSNVSHYINCPFITLPVLLVCFKLKVTTNMYTLFSGLWVKRECFYRPSLAGKSS